MSKDLFKFIDGSSVSGESTYDIYRATINEEATAQDFLEYMRSGPKGDKGDTGSDAYSAWLEIEGNEGKSREEFLETVKGETGKTAYEYAKEGGFTGSEEEFTARMNQLVRFNLNGSTLEIFTESAE